VQITIDQDSGFCFGVVYAIEMAEGELMANKQLYCLGDIVHNDVEVNRLTQKGLQIITHDDLKNLKNCKVLIRAHGEPPETYKIALENNIELIDASCPVVLKLQNRIKNTYDKVKNINGQIIIYGKPGHAEVNSLWGQTNKTATIISGEEDLDKIDFSKPIYLFSQTTKSTKGFYKIKEIIAERALQNNGKLIESNDTICRQVSNRDIKLKEFAQNHERIIFVSGKKSSNGKVLYDACKTENPNSYFISEESELNPEWLIGANSVGICGATSTPMWLMEKVASHIKKKFN